MIAAASAVSAEEPRISASLDPTRITIGDRVRLTLKVDAPQESEINFPDLKPYLGDLALKGSGKETANTFWAVVTAYEVKPHLISSIPVVVRLPSGESMTVQTPPLSVEVVTVLKEGEKMEDIRDIKGPVGLPVPHFGAWIWIGSLALFGLLAGLFWRLRKKVQPVPVVPAHLKALQALKEIEAMGLDQKNIKEYYSLVSGILRRYLEERFGFRAPEQTTEEFLSSVVANHVLYESQKELLGSFLQHCDLVKFANYAPKREEVSWIFETARGFIEQTKPDV